MNSKYRNLEEYNKRFVGKTCFILGSGCSIIDQLKDFDKLGGHITIAVNSGYLAYLQSDFFVSDDWSVANWSYFFKDLAESQKTIALLYDQKLEPAASLFGQRAVLFRHKKGYELNPSYSHSDRRRFIWEARTSVGTAIHVAHIMGCNRIVLVGVDGRRTHDYRYFWQMPEWTGEKPSRNDDVKIDTFKRCRIGSVPSDVDLAAINAYWEKIGRVVGISLYNASPNSVIRNIKHIQFRDALEGRFYEQNALRNTSPSRIQRCAPQKHIPT